MRFAAFAFLLTACTTAGQVLSPPERVLGCWADRNGAAHSVMRWRAGEAPGSAAGEFISQSATPESRPRFLALKPNGAGWTLCDTTEGGACWAVAQGESGSLEGGRAFIDRHHDRLSFSVVGADGRDLLRFVGESEACS